MKNELTIAQKIAQGKIEKIRREQASMNAAIVAATKKNNPSGNVSSQKDQQAPEMPV